MFFPNHAHHPVPPQRAPSPHVPPCALVPKLRLTCFGGGAALLADGRATAHLGAGAQVELVGAEALQVDQDPLRDVWAADVHGAQLAQVLRVVY